MASLADQIARFEALRAQAPPLPTDSAAYTTSAFFKSQAAGGGDRPKAKPWSHRLSVDSRAQGSSPLKAANRGKNMDMITLGTARPSPQFYPFESLTVSCVDDASAGEDKKATSVTCAKGDDAYDLAAALNYGFPAGSPQSVRFFTEHVEMMHRPPYEDWKTSLTCGTTSGLEMVFRIFCDPGDNILVEKYSYTGTLVAARAQRIRTVPIDMDEFGLSVEELDKTLSSWDSSKAAKPHVLYTIPTGQNPTSVTQSVERRKAIYEVAEKHDIIIIEDDPYFFLQLGKSYEGDTNSKEALEEYVNRLPPSYLSLDVSGRVVRLDSTSKILSPGLRLGWLTACAQVVDLFEAYSEVSVLAPSGPSQVMVNKLLDQTWGHTGFVRWLAHLSSVYTNRLGMMVEACERHLPPGICSWTLPDSGMFVWIYVDVTRHPKAPPEGPTQEFESEVEGALYERSRDRGVLISRGSWFLADATQPSRAGLRVTFAAATEPELAPGIERLGRAVREEFGLA